MEKEQITINIGNVANGAMVEAFQLELDKVLKNIMDPSTEATAKRYIRLELMLKPKDDRIQLNTEFTCTSKLAGIIPVDSRIFIGRTEDGVLVPLQDDPRQMNIFAPPEPVKAPSVILFKAAGEQ
jgi:hypothetical protein